MLAKSALALVLSAHGLIHLMGFAKAFGFGDVTAINQPISRSLGVAWLIACAAMLVAAGMVVLKQATWWLPAVCGVLLSQILIMSVWQSAKFGTIANLIILVAALPGLGSWRFAGMVEEEVHSLLTSAQTEGSVVTDEALTTLPPIVQSWLRQSGVVGKPAVHLVYLEQRGQMKMKPRGGWMSFNAKQIITVIEPQFVWAVQLKMGLPIAGRDKYIAGRGNMLIQVASILPVVNATGPETDQGSLLRYLAEISWCPSAALQPWLTWEQTGPLSAKAILSNRGQVVEGQFTFTQEGDFAGFEAQRYYARPTGPTLERWTIKAVDWKEFGGVRIPARCEVSWQLKEGTFTWLELEVTLLQVGLPRNQCPAAVA